MKNFKKRISKLLIIFLFITTMTACNNDDIKEGAENYALMKEETDYLNLSNKPVDMDFMVEEEKVITLGEIDVIEPILNFPEANVRDVRWHSTDESVATVSAVGLAGIITSQSKGTTTISVSMKVGDQTITKSTELRVASKGRDTILVLDISGSMEGTPMEEMKKSAIQFCKDLLSDELNNRVGIVCYDSSVYTIDLTNDLESLIYEINYLYDGSATNMEGGLAAAKEMMDRSDRPDAIKNIVIMADGLPNEGKVSSSGSYGEMIVDHSDWGWGWFDYDEAEYFNAVVDTANDIKESYHLYSLGFFHSLPEDYWDDAEELMRKIAKSDQMFYIVDKAENLQFVFGDIAESISNGSRIVINIACPVDVTVRYQNEKLSSAKIDYVESTSFGTLQLLGKEQDIKVLSLDFDNIYDIELMGTDEGIMNLTMNYFDEVEELIDYRKFSAVPLSDTTIMYSSTDNVGDIDVELHIDKNGDGMIDEVMKAGKNTEIVYEAEKDGISVFMILLIVACVTLSILIVIVFIVTKKKKKQTFIETEVVPPVSEQEPVNGSIGVMTGSMEGMVIPILDGDTIHLGKDPKVAHLVFTPDYTHVSRLHCTIVFSEQHQKYYVTDCSSNGTYRENGERLEKGKRISMEPNSVIYLANEHCFILLK